MMARRAKAVLDAVDQAEGAFPAALQAALGNELRDLRDQIIPLLMAMVPDLLKFIGMLGVVAALGAAAGGAVGVLAFGVGAVPGAVFGATAAVEAALEFMGLAFLVSFVGEALVLVFTPVSAAVRKAWNSVDQPRSQRKEIADAAQIIAVAGSQFFCLCLKGLALFLVAEGAASAAAKVPELVGKLRASKTGPEFAKWFEGNWKKLVDSPLAKKEWKPKTESAGGTSATTTAPIAVSANEPIVMRANSRPLSGSDDPPRTTRQSVADRQALEVEAANQRALKIANSGSVTTPEDRAVFYSGPGNRAKALAARDNGYVPIDDTPCGKALESEDLYGESNPLRNQADGYWSEASRRYADGASGDVTAYVHGASPSRVFGQTELPALLENPNVSSINGVPTQLLRSMEDNEPGSAFRAIEGGAPL